MADKPFKIDGKVMSYIATILFICVIAIYVVFLMPTHSEMGNEGNVATEVKGEAPIAVINVSGGIKISGTENMLLVRSGESITFDASNSYDPDGEIVEYEWSFGDESTESGKTVSHTFYLDQESFSEYGTVTYSVVLRVYDNSLPYGRMGDDLLFVTVVPSKLYFDKGMPKIDAPAEYKKNVKLPIFGSGTVELIYNLSNPFYMPSSPCNITLHIEKPRLSIITKISIVYYDADGNEIPLAEIPRSKLFGFWKEKMITASGAIQDTGGGIAGFKIRINGLSVRGISLIYGGDEPSLIEFAFA